MNDSYNTPADDLGTLETMQDTPTLTPRLVVADADRAIEFYQRGFDAELLERLEAGPGHVVHAALRIHGAIISLTQENAAHENLAPPALGGSPVILTLSVDDPDAVGAQLEAAGAQVIFPIADQFYGYREGRLRDPFGHLWILSKLVERLTPEQIQARMRGG